MLKKTILAVTVLATLAGTTLSANPRQSIAPAYKHDRRAVNQAFDHRDDVLRAQQRAVQDRERDAWLSARKFAPPAERKYIDQEYHARRKALNQQFDARRDSLDRWHDHTRDVIQDDFKNSLRAYESDRRYYDSGRIQPHVNHYAPAAPVYGHDHGHGYGYTPQFGPPIDPHGYGARPAPARDIVLGILNAVLN
jgi:hypothetical protein